MSQLPNDALRFFQEGRQLAYDSEESSIGRIVLKSVFELATSIIRVDASEVAGIVDPYRGLGGHYQCEVIDLVKSSEDYDPQGLLCWIIAVQRFGCIDPDHGTVLSFPDANWTDIVKNPVIYLDSQWGVRTAGCDVASELLLPWLYFDLKMAYRRVVLKPYLTECERHRAPVARRAMKKPDLFM